MAGDGARPTLPVVDVSAENNSKRFVAGLVRAVAVFQAPTRFIADFDPSVGLLSPMPKGFRKQNLQIQHGVEL
jgi:hypothetical protein